MNKSKPIGIVAAAAVIGISFGVFFIFSEKENGEEIAEEIAPPQSNFWFDGGSGGSGLPAISSGGEHNGGEESGQGRLAEEVSGRYVNSSYGFSFRIPDGFHQSSFPDPRGELLNVEKSPKEGFQLYITPYDIEGPLTADFIRSEIPDLPMKNVKNATLDSVRAVVFESENESFGPTFEVWFVWPQSPIPNGNYLYQITTYKDFTAGLSQILQTWKFSQ